MIYLDVQYRDKDEAKALGAKWDAETKKWYVPAGVLATPFERWMTQGGDGDKLLAGVKKDGVGTAKPKAVRSHSGNDSKALAPIDSRSSKVIVGAHYKEAVGAVGLPWA